MLLLNHPHSPAFGQDLLFQRLYRDQRHSVAEVVLKLGHCLVDGLGLGLGLMVETNTPLGSEIKRPVGSEAVTGSLDS